MKRKSKKYPNESAIMELVDDYKQWPGLVKTTELDVIIKSPGQPYEIDLAKCDTHRKALEQVIFLAEKNWVTKEILVLFAHHALAYADKLLEQAG